MRLITLILILISFSSAAEVIGDPRQEDMPRPWQLACLDRGGLLDVLDTVEDPYQFLSNRIYYKILSKNGCSYQQLPSGSVVVSSGFHNTAEYERLKVPKTGNESNEKTPNKVKRRKVKNGAVRNFESIL